MGASDRERQTLAQNADMRSLRLGPHSTSAKSASTQDARPIARTRLVLVYLALAFLALIPGLMLRLDLGFGGSPADAPLQVLRSALDDIRFGSGIRFWMGVAGATLLLLLLLYPLRKILGPRSPFGSVSAWFHIHLIIGLGGPVLILYHCNFGLGSRNANVALWSMLAVVASGIVGHFVYQTVSAEFYAGKQKARDQILAITSALEPLAALRSEREAIVDELGAFDTELLTPRRGILAGLQARWIVENRRRYFGRLLGQHLADCAALLQLSRGDYDRLRTVIDVHLDAYFRYARQASSRSLREQFWSRWRLFHLPVFLILVVAVALHIAAVWNMEPPSTAEAPIKPAIAQAPAVEAAPKRLRGGGPDVRRVTSIPITPVVEATAPPTAPAAPLATEPRPATRPADIPSKLNSAQRPSATAPTLRTRLSEPPPVIVAAPPPQPLAQEIADLKRHEDQRMALGGAKPSELAAQIAALKEKQKLQQFFHSEIETGFPLAGRHQRLDCAACHSKPVRESRQAIVRGCVACHSKDDIHRGKRPNCALCHTAVRWNQRIKSK